jgi:hypothetical protein
VVLLLLLCEFCWAFLLAFCGFASRHLRFSNGFLKYANEAVLPFYILHQTIILTVGYYVLRLDTSLWIEYVIIATISFIVIMALYELLIRRINVLRFLFGLKMVPRPLLAYLDSSDGWPCRWDAGLTVRDKRGSGAGAFCA